ncbi:ABC transporter, ATP-binding protein [sediment metagenome]|uniref:ABC transporter, ATP-binding protein n=1 Tax=sediment metagenome TaxID=749907 RepID=D9PLI7_9ZZZZ
MSITVQNITKRFGNQLALDKVSFSIEKGEIVGFIGPNGAGKSTLIKIITGYLRADEGEVLVNNIGDSIEMRKIIGYLPENNPLYPEMYVREYLGYVAGFYRNLPDKKRRIEEIIHETGLKPESHKKINELSKGYRQRVGIAQALLHNPEILILDEPTSGLDPNQIVEIRNLISLAGKEKTVILSTHIMQEVEAICDKVLILRNGRIVANGKPSEISQSRIADTITILVEFDKDPDQGKLSGIEGIIKMVAIKPGQFLIESEANNDIRPVIFNYAVSAGLTVLSMQKKEKRLEDVFRELTRE